MDGLLSEKHGIVRRAVRAFCDREIRPLARDLDIEARFPWDVVEKMGKLGYFGIQVPEELGGAGMDTISYSIVIEEISRACAGLGLCVTVHNSVGVYPILAFGNEEQKRRYVPPLAKGEKIGAFCLTEPNVGSDASGVESTAVRDGDHYIVNANKVLLTNGGVADTCLFFVKTGDSGGRSRLSVIIVERGTPGFEVGDLEDLSGNRANPVSSIRLYDCRVPTENLLGGDGQGMKIGLAALDAARRGGGAHALGIAQAAMEEGVRCSQQRRQFGVPISQHQAIQTMIADMATEVEASRLLINSGAAVRDSGRPFSKEAAMAKLFASETPSKVADMAIQIHGGYGYSKAYPVERFYRDARITRIYEGTSERSEERRVGK